jgi:uncharacterized membrane protein (DUF441 family)
MQRFLTGLAIAVLTIGVASPALAGPIAVPEIDPSVAQSVLTMLVGGVLVLLGLRQRD